jgi:hypothetical protein
MTTTTTATTAPIIDAVEGPLSSVFSGVAVVCTVGVGVVYSFDGTGVTEETCDSSVAPKEVDVSFRVRVEDRLDKRNRSVTIEGV